MQGTLSDMFDGIQPQTREEVGLPSKNGMPMRIPREEEVDRVVSPPQENRSSKQFMA